MAGKIARPFRALMEIDGKESVWVAIPQWNTPRQGRDALMADNIKMHKASGRNARFLEWIE
jgi:hypothetical protein